jgi:predicted porin
MKGNFYEAPVDSANPGFTNPENEGTFRGVGRYSGEKFAIGALYQNMTNVEGIKDWKSTTFGGAAKYQAAPKWALKAGVYVVNPDTDATDDPATTDIDESDNQGTLIAVGVDHTFAKDLLFYAQFATMSNGAAADFSLGDGGHGMSIDPALDETTGQYESPNGFSVGVLKKF